MEINIPNSVLEIKDSAFLECNQLKKATLPEGIKYIGAWSFSSCHELLEINIPNSVLEIIYEAFYDCRKLKKATLPEGIKYIGARSFVGHLSVVVNYWKLIYLIVY